MSIDWNAVLSGTIAFIFLTILKTLLDLRLGQLFVKYFSWIPVRTFFRDNPTNLSGQWEHVWGAAESQTFKSCIDRHGHPILNQFGSYCYGEFISKGVTYVVFGRVIGNYFVGDWYDQNDRTGYFGAFQLEVRDLKNMCGRWVGHSKTVHEVRCAEWVWKKIS